MTTKTLELTPKWVNKDLYPFRKKSIELSAGRMNYIDEGTGEILLFIHGTPTWSFLYRDFVKELSSSYRCIAIDHIGFGLSDKPKDFDGKPESHSRNLTEFIDKLALKNITLIVHDFGGPIGLYTAVKKSEKIKRVVLFNTWCWETKSIKAAQKINKIVNSGIGKFLYLNMNFSPKVLLKKAYYSKAKLSKTIHSQYIGPFSTKESRISLLNLAKSLVGSSDWFQKNYTHLDSLRDKPMLFLWGTNDSFLTPIFLEKWKKTFPKAEFYELESGHFVQEELPQESIGLIRRFLTMHP